jgi:hypothetical protein
MRFPRHQCTAGPFDPYYLLNPEACLYIGQFSSFVHAYTHWRTLGEKWFILSTDDARRVMTRPGSAQWYKLEEPRPLKVPLMNGYCPGRFNAQNKTNAQGAKRGKRRML